MWVAKVAQAIKTNHLLSSADWFVAALPNGKRDREDATTFAAAHGSSWCSDVGSICDAATMAAMVAGHAGAGQMHLKHHLIDQPAAVLVHQFQRNK